MSSLPESLTSIARRTERMVRDGLFPTTHVSLKPFLLGLLALELLLFVPSLKLGLVADDFVFEKVAERPISQLWSEASDVHGHFRPLSYTIKHLLYGALAEEPLGWHAVNIVIHFATVLLFFWIVCSALPLRHLVGPAPAFLAAAFAQVHPSAAQNVFWASGLTDLLVMFFFLGATYSILQYAFKGRARELLVGVLLFGAALLSKESAVVLPLVLVAIGWMLRGDDSPLQLDPKVRKRYRTALLWLAGTSVAFLLVFSLVAGSEFMHDYKPQTPLEYLLVLAKGCAMVILPEDAWSIYASFWSGDVWSLAAAVAPAVILLVVVALQRRLSPGWAISLAVCLGIVMAPYLAGGYLAQRLVYAGTFVFAFHLYCLWVARSNVVQGSSRLSLLLAFLLYIVVVANSSFAVSRDWRKADQRAKEIRSAFVELYRHDPRQSYVFVALPNRLRQAWIIGEAYTDFSAALRSVGIQEEPTMEGLVRVVFTDGNPDMDRIDVSLAGDDALYVTARDRGAFLLFADVRAPLDQPIGARYRGDGYETEVLHHQIGSRAAAVRVTLDGKRIPRVVVYDGAAGRFRTIEVGKDGRYFRSVFPGISLPRREGM